MKEKDKRKEKGKGSRVKEINTDGDDRDLDKGINNGY